jgi:hypothetical protein
MCPFIGLKMPLAIGGIVISSRITTLKNRFRIIEFQKKISEEAYISRALESIAIALTISIRKRDIVIHEGQE